MIRRRKPVSLELAASQVVDRLMVPWLQAAFQAYLALPNTAEAPSALLRLIMRYSLTKIRYIIDIVEENRASAGVSHTALRRAIEQELSQRPPSPALRR